LLVIGRLLQRRVEAVRAWFNCQTAQMGHRSHVQVPVFDWGFRRLAGQDVANTRATDLPDA
jgi:hypothetical protein